MEDVAATVQENVSIELAIAQSPQIALLDPVKKAELYAFLEREVESFIPDLSTEASRKKIAALAYKVARTKTAIDDSGAELKAEWLKKSQAIDLSRREIREKLDALRDKARKPLTDWENAEASRIDLCEKQMQSFAQARMILESDTSETVSVLLEAIVAEDVLPEVWGDSLMDAVHEKSKTVDFLKAAAARLKVSEQGKAELEQLREKVRLRELADREAAEAAELERLRKAAEEREALRQKEQAEAARIAEEKRAAAEEARVAQAAKDAAGRVQRELEAAAKKEAERIEAEHQAELAKERKLREEAEAAQREKDRLAAEVEAQRKAEEARVKAEDDRKAAEQRKLLANKKHRQTVMDAAAKAIQSCGEIAAHDAEQVVIAIVNGEIPHVTLSFTE